jgi:hypothetical protein
MGQFVFNINKGKVAELMARVNANDPTNAVAVIAILATSGIESDATLIDKDDMAALVSGTTNYVTNSGYTPKVIDQTGGITVTTDDTGDKQDVDCPDQTWTTVGAGDGWNDLVTAYDSDSTSGTSVDSAVKPMTQHDFVLVPDGSDITAQIANFFSAS